VEEGRRWDLEMRGGLLGSHIVIRTVKTKVKRKHLI